MADFYISDTHFGHYNIIKYCHRPFTSSKHMDQTMVTNWNNKVSPDDTVFHLGDVIFGGSAEMKEILPKLNGKKILIDGNHDEPAALAPYFSAVYKMFSYTNLEHKVKVIMCHYPFETWPGERNGAIHLHGHCHGTLEHKIKNRMDVGIDCHPKFEPWSMREILSHLRKY